jgi:hypothetical protein
MSDIKRMTVDDEVLATEIYAKLLPELSSLSKDELTFINVDMPSVVATVLGALPEVRALRSELERVPDFDLATFDKLEDYATALGYTHAQYVTATQPSDDLEALSEEALGVREQLLADATALSLRGFIDGNRLKELRGANGYKNLATDLQGLAGILQESWAAVQGRSGVEMADLERAMKLGQRLLRVVGLREQGPATAAVATDIRQRAFTVLTRAWDQVRRAVMFLRWNIGDADQIAPSLYAGRGNRRKTPVETPLPDTEPSVPVPSAPAAGPGAVPHGTNGATEMSNDGPFVG